MISSSHCPPSKPSIWFKKRDKLQLSSINKAKQKRNSSAVGVKNYINVYVWRNHLSTLNEAFTSHHKIMLEGEVMNK